MDWSERMNTAVDYIEENLAGEIDFNKAAAKAACSIFHFQRIFFAVNGLTPADYARRRKLTLAATELSTGNAKVIDTALKYGYDSPNAFTRAFRQLHGITPQAAREPGAKLTTYPRIFFHIKLEGGNNMDYKLVEKPAFDIVGKSRKINLINGQDFIGTKQFWQEYLPTKECQILFELGKKHGPVIGADMMGVEMLIDGHYDPLLYVICVEKLNKMDGKGFEVFHIPAATYAIFNCTLETLADVASRVFSEWFPSSGYRIDTKPLIEAYFLDNLKIPPERCQLWYPVVKKNKK